MLTVASTLNHRVRRSRDGKTPLQSCSGKAPSFERLRVFGRKRYGILRGNTQASRTRIHPIVSKHLRPRAFRRVHLGYRGSPGDIQGFKVFVPLLRRAVTVRDVVFDEGSFYDVSDDHRQQQLHGWHESPSPAIVHGG